MCLWQIGYKLAGFSFHISGRGGLDPEGGGMARDLFVTKQLINNVSNRCLSCIIYHVYKR